MEFLMVAMLVILITFSGVAFLVIMNAIRNVEYSIDVLSAKDTQKKLEQELDRFEHKMPKPTFYEPVTVDDGK